MSEHTLAEVTAAIVASWSRATCYAQDDYVARGRLGDRSRGQCGTTALVLNDFLGGDLIVADVFVNGQKDGVHYWNRLPDGRAVDLTGNQFQSNEILGASSELSRPPGPPIKGLAQYSLLSDRVASVLASPSRERSII
jgi:hypothetical protein